jgi:hypothetical protein
METLPDPPARRRAGNGARVAAAPVAASSASPTKPQGRNDLAVKLARALEPRGWSYRGRRRLLRQIAERFARLDLEELARGTEGSLP